MAALIPLLPLAALLAGASLLWLVVGVLDRFRFFQLAPSAEERPNHRNSLLRTAHVVGTLDVQQKPPRLVAVFVYSEPAEQLTSAPWSEQKFDILSATAESYEEAQRIAVARLREYPHLGWALHAYEHPWEDADCE